MPRLALISDVHMRDEQTTMLREGLERVAERLETFDPDHAFVLGDVVEHGATGAVDRENVRRVRSVLDPCRSP